MSRFKYSADEMDINKVLKMNQNISTALLEDTDMEKIRSDADSSINSSLELLGSLGKNKKIQQLSAEIAKKSQNKPLEHRTQLESWDEIVLQANLQEPNPVVIEDIMTEDEIQNAVNELDEINKQFSNKTSLINKTDLSFLAIAITLQVVKTLVFPYVADKFDYGNGFDPSQRLEHNDKSIEKEHKEANDKFRVNILKKHGKGHWIIFYIRLFHMILQQALKL